MHILTSYMDSDHLLELWVALAAHHVLPCPAQGSELEQVVSIQPILDETRIGLGETVTLTRSHPST